MGRTSSSLPLFSQQCFLFLRAWAAVACVLLAVGSPAAAQKVVPGSYQGERLLAIVPMTGAGTLQDPRRPLFAPFAVPAIAPTARVVTAADAKPENRESILAFRYELSSDKRFALVEFVAADTGAFAALRNAGRSDVRVFERNRTDKDEIEREFRKYKPEFSLDGFLAGGAR